LCKKLDASSVLAKQLHLANAQRRKFSNILASEYNNDYLVLTMQAVDADGTNTFHFHSIVVKVGSEKAWFDFDGMLDCHYLAV
jgi:hypothetical protein